MLFATVCGSSWYYGRSGCTLFGYLRAAPAEEWREVYNSEGLNLYIDPNASKGGWPDLLTLEPVGGLEPMRWTWTGERYELARSALRRRRDAGSRDAVTGLSGGA